MEVILGNLMLIVFNFLSLPGVSSELLSSFPSPRVSFHCFPSLAAKNLLGTSTA